MDVDIIDDANSLTIFGEDTGHSVLLKLALLPRKDRCQTRSCIQAESLACLKNWVDQVVVNCFRGLLVSSRPRSELCVGFHHH